jgi:GDP-4-dehydro-6-deoxy-D-mannose reductase
LGNGRVLITGGTGFLGSHLTREFAARGLEVLSTYLDAPPVDLPKGRGVSYVRLDVTDRKAVDSLIESWSPSVVYHFAGQAFVTPSWNDPRGTFEANVTGTLNVLEAIRRLNSGTSIAFAGSGTEYGAPEQIPTSEEAPLRPLSPYASSKAAADLLCYQYYKNFGIPAYRFRIFGTTGPGKLGDACNDFAKQVALIRQGRNGHAVHVGNLDKDRDITHVRDAVKAMITVVERGIPGEAYNIGSGVRRPVRSILEGLIRIAGVECAVKQDPAKIRLTDEPVHLADVTKLKSLGWKPGVPFERMLEEILHYWESVREAS